MTKGFRDKQCSELRAGNRSIVFQRSVYHQIICFGPQPRAKTTPDESRTYQ